MTPPSSVDLRLMRYVVAVAEEEGFHRAARRLHIAQSALSRQVRQLESELGVELFLRRPTARMTGAGQTFVGEARRILADVERAVGRTRLVARGEVGTVRVGHTVTAAFDALPRLVDKASSDHPRIEVETGERWGAELVAGLDDGSFDVALGHHLDGSPGTASAVLRRERLAAVVPVGHPLARRPNITLADLRGETLRFPPRRLAPRYFDLVIAALGLTGEALEIRESAHPRLGSFGVDGLGGFTVVPSSVGERLPRTVTCVPLTDPLPVVDLVVMWRPESASPAAQLVIETASKLAAAGLSPRSAGGRSAVCNRTSLPAQ